MCICLKKGRVYTLAMGFTIRENDALAVVNLLRSESLQAKAGEFRCHSLHRSQIFEDL